MIVIPVYGISGRRRLVPPQFDGQLPPWEAWPWVVCFTSRKHCHSTPDQSSTALILLIICKEHLQSKWLQLLLFLPSQSSRGGKFVALASDVAQPTSSRLTVEDVTQFNSVAIIRCGKHIFCSVTKFDQTRVRWCSFQRCSTGHWWWWFLWWGSALGTGEDSNDLTKVDGRLRWISLSCPSKIVPCIIILIRTHLDSDLTWEDGPPGYILLSS